MTPILRPCPACGADRPLGERYCPSCGARWTGVPPDAPGAPLRAETPRDDGSPQAGTDTRLRGAPDARPQRGSTRQKALSAGAWLRALAWVAAGWLGMDAVVHLLHGL